MLVDADGIVGSVGGGQLEFEIIASARVLLAQGGGETKRQHFILGPDLRQCCGGALDIVLEPLAADSADWLRQVEGDLTDGILPGSLLDMANSRISSTVVSPGIAVKSGPPQ